MNATNEDAKKANADAEYAWKALDSETRWALYDGEIGRDYFIERFGDAFARRSFKLGTDPYVEVCKLLEYWIVVGD